MSTEFCEKGLCLILVQVTNDLIVIVFDSMQLPCSDGDETRDRLPSATQVHPHSPIREKFQTFLLELFQALHFADSPWELSIPPRSRSFIHLGGCFYKSTVTADVYSQFLQDRLGQSFSAAERELFPTFLCFRISQ